jgi:uncharacterized membrane protein YgcG
MSEVLKERSLQLGTRPDGSGRSGRLQINPNRFNRVSLSARSGEKWINADLTIDAWDDLLASVKMAAASKETYRHDIACKKRDQVVSTVMVGRDNDGLVFLALGSPDTPAVRFEFLPLKQYAHALNGQPMPESEMSRRRAINWVNRVGEIVAREWEKNYMPEQRQDTNKGFGGNKSYGGNGGGNRNYGGGGNNFNSNNNRPPAADGDFDDFINI